MTAQFYNISSEIQILNLKNVDSTLKEQKFYITK